MNNVTNVEQKLLNNIFGQTPNKENLIAFFKIEIIKILWWGNKDNKKESFINSSILKDELNNISSKKREKLFKHFAKIENEIELK